MFSRTEIIAVVCCVGLTGSLYYTSTNKNTAVATREFQLQAEDGMGALQARFSAYFQSLNGVGAFFRASEYVSFEDFNTYAEGLDFSGLLPGLSGLGFVEEVPDAELESFVSRVRLESGSDYQLRRLSDEPVHQIIKYMYPNDTNAAALGLDITYSPELKVVLDTARATGETQMSHPIQLVQETASRLGFALYMPVFGGAPEVGQPKPFLGWVDAPFVAANLIGDLGTGGGKNYVIKIEDGETEENKVTIFDNDDGSVERGKYASVQQLEMFGRNWTVTFNSTAGFDRAFLVFQPLLILIVGILLTLLLLFTLRAYRFRNASLREIAALRVRQINAREEENRAIIENEVTSVIVVDGDNHVLFANQAALKCFGYTDAELKALKFNALITPTNNQSDSHNATGKTKSGQALELDLQRNNWVTHTGEIRTTAIIRDVTVQNKAQRDVKRSRTLYDLALQGSEIGVFDVDLTTGRSQVSKTWRRLLEIDDESDDLDTQSIFLSRIHPDDISVINEADADCISGKTARSCAEYRLKSLDGSWRWMRSDAVVVERDEEGKALRLIGTQMDITSLRHDRNALESSESRFRQVLANAPIGMAILNSRSQFTGVNNAFCAMAGKSEYELLNHATLSDLIPDEERKALFTAIGTQMNSCENSVYTGEHQIFHTSGEVRWALFNVTWSYDANADDHFFIAQVIDITDQKKMDQMKSEFVSTVSHELRTPLTSIKGALGLLNASKTANFSKNETRLLEIASANTDRLTVIVNDILDLEKISSGEMVFHFEDVDANVLINAVAKEMAPFAITHDCEIVVDLPPLPLCVHADEGRTRQVLANLISNACKYSNPATKVLVKAEVIDNSAIVYVQNSGPGVPESFRSDIFKAFSQADSSDTRAIGGTGLGLNISRQIVHRHGGKIGFESVIDGVTVFWFTIPLAEEGKKPANAESDPTHQASTGKHLSVLHVEDDHDFAEIISGALSDKANVLHANTLVKAKRIIRGKPLDVVILDWRLPDGDASSLLDELIKLQPNARLIAFSADNERPVDPRLFANIVKSRIELSAVVDTVNKCVLMAS